MAASMSDGLRPALLTIAFLLAVFPGPATAAGPLPDGGIARAEGSGIIAARYVLPTTRYGHGVLGDRIEAGGLWVGDAGGNEYLLELGPDSVFEDITPRLHDLDGDGGAEVIAIRAYLDRGAALSVIDIVDGEARIIAETEPIGRTNRWLNPAGVADYDGDGRVEIALIKTPHIGGILEIYELRGDSLRREAREAGYSTHAIGSRALDLSASLDVDGDGVIDLVVPDQPRTALVALSFAGGRLSVIGRVGLGVQVTGDISVRGTELRVPVADRAMVRIRAGDFR